MKKSSVTFLSTRREIVDFIEKIRAGAEVTITTANDENELSVLQADAPITDDCRYVYINLGAVFEKEHGLFICMGQDDQTCIKESLISVAGDGYEFEYWKKKISQFKRTLLKGAYVVNPHFDRKAYYKNVYYTTGAKAAFDHGIQMKPMAGWNFYLLDELR
ncbi:MAG: hypothetical protein IJY28_10560 [Clostridia bacterium]|nr:hypothetical protein [Clostridia bacterium]